MTGKPEQKKDPLAGVEYDEQGRIIPTADGRERERYDIPLQLKKSFVMRDAASPVPVKQQYERPEIPVTDSEPAKMPPVVQKPIVQEDIALTMEPIVEEPSVAAAEPMEAPTKIEGQPKEEAPAVQETILEPEQEILPEVKKVVFRVVGEVLNTYIVVEHEGKMTLIDKHAAHERIHFDRLSAYTADAPSQMLLMPEVIRLSREDYQLVWDNIGVFEQLGYELEQFGDDALMLRSVPADIDLADGRGCVEELCENLRAGRAVTYEQVRQELLKTVACKAAIKAGKSSQPAELAALAEAVLSGKVKYCPHGRPVSVTYTKTQLDKQFDRIV